ncbi:MAG: SpoIIE family protein phosphatase [Lachnospiraceae bacterium]|nr:SpoIIE family protein phosphatase [Lachnospiraceae bacterium]
MKKKKKIANVITVWLIIIVVAACFVSVTLTYISLSDRSEENTKNLVRSNVEDVSKDINEMIDLIVLDALDEWVPDAVPSADLEDPEDYSNWLHENYYGYGAEINIVNDKGIIIASSVPEYIGFDMHSGEQAAEFLCLLDGSKEVYTQDLRGTTFDDTVVMKYNGKRFPDGSGFLQLGLTYESYLDEIKNQAEYSATNRRIGENGHLIISDESHVIFNSYHNEYTDKTLEDAGIVIESGKDYDYEDVRCDVFGEPSYVNINKTNGVYIIGVYPVKEAITSVNTMLLASVLLEAVVFSILFVALIILLRKLIVKNMVKVNDALNLITEGNLDERIEVRDTYEFDVLSTDINATVDKLKGYIDEAAARIDADLAVAEAIQSSALPNIFPPYPERKDFELFACMNSAKVIGGDFYDFYMLGQDTLGFLIADVSGKSIPAAMFMMTGKTIIKGLAESGLAPADVFTRANDKLCEGNDAELFITAWMGYVDLTNGLVHVANAGHNPPILIRDGKAEYIVLKPGLMLAGMEGTRYMEQTLQLQKGDILYLYTDGVTEAMDGEENLYGEDRLRELLSFGENYPEPSGSNGIAGAVCELVTADIERFVRGAEQSDDITMLCVRWIGKED